ncbi:carbohydrate ABC transporter permease [Haloactinomyces albus]|uniref:Multiple sugar transport system permease protein n=1 Tax=Haloactinomyces albus TaxID=1352928 RepID=A0AAE3ZHY6_9ACTN|nr:sugar ABC transporter permease [Haloactinomyces albus]MDR7303547.1 multiple sugar transport system permease protein [Haloactinomyces albus]
MTASEGTTMATTDVDAEASRTRLTSGPTQRGRGRRRLSESRLGDYLFVLPAVAFIALLMLYPLFYNVKLSLYDVNLGNFLSGERPFVGLQNYVEAFGSSAFWHSLGTSLVYTGSSILLSFVLGYALALFFNRAFPGNGVMRAILLVTYVLPSVVSGTVWRWMLQGDSGIVNAVLLNLGIIDEPIFWLVHGDTAMISVVTSTVWVTSPFVMILLLAGLQSIPEGLYEAAKIDGASAVKRFWYVTMPAMRPVALTVLLLSFIFTFKTFDNIFVMTKGGPGDATTITPIYAYEKAFGFFEFSDGAVASTVLIAISVLMALVYFKLSQREEAA